jgi:hypothetical protein
MASLVFAAALLPALTACPAGGGGVEREVVRQAERDAAKVGGEIGGNGARAGGVGVVTVCQVTDCLGDKDK